MNFHQKWSVNQVVDALSWTLLHFVWQGFLIGIILWLVLSLCHRQTPQLRYLLCALAMCACITVPILTFAHIYQSNATPAQVFNESLVIPQPFAAETVVVERSWWLQWISFLPGLSLLWLAGVVFFTFKLLKDLLLVKQLSRQGVKPVNDSLAQIAAKMAHRLGVIQSFRVLQSSIVNVPMVIGWLKPVILLPTAITIGLSAQQLEMVLAHELAHIRRQDYLVNLVQLLAEILLFFHPIVHWISKEMRNEREYCCDDIALQLGNDAFAYARTLTATEDLKQGNLPLTAMASTGGNLKSRVLRVVNYHCHPKGLEQWIALSLIFTTLMIGAIVQAHIIPPTQDLTVAAKPSLIETVAKIEVVKKEPALLKASENKLASLKSQAVAFPPKVELTPIAHKNPAAKALLPISSASEQFEDLDRRSAEQATQQLASFQQLKVLNVEHKHSLPQAAPEKVIEPAKASVSTIAVAIKSPAPKYPVSAKRRKIEQNVSVSFDIDRTGHVSNLTFLNKDNSRYLKKSVRSTLNHWLFKPATLDGIAVISKQKKIFVFVLDPASKHMVISSIGTKIKL